MLRMVSWLIDRMRPESELQSATRELRETTQFAHEKAATTDQLVAEIKRQDVRDRRRIRERM